MDCTGSMDQWIKESATNLVKIINTVKANCRFDADIRIAYVGYRDFGDIGDKDHFDFIDYTTDHERVADKIKRSRASGGGDAAEDVKGALDFAFRLTHKSPTLHVFIICDAPTHGSQYHDNVLDDHSKQPERSLENSLLKFKSIPGNTCYFTAIQLTTSTAKMFSIMKKEFGNNFIVTEKKLPEDFFDTMLKSLTSTIESTRLLT